MKRKRRRRLTKLTIGAKYLSRRRTRANPQVTLEKDNGKPPSRSTRTTRRHQVAMETPQEPTVQKRARGRPPKNKGASDTQNLPATQLDTARVAQRSRKRGPVFRLFQESNQVNQTSNVSKKQKQKSAVFKLYGEESQKNVDQILDTSRKRRPAMFKIYQESIKRRRRQRQRQRKLSQKKSTALSPKTSSPQVSLQLCHLAVQLRDDCSKHGMATDKEADQNESAKKPQEIDNPSENSEGNQEPPVDEPPTPEKSKPPIETKPCYVKLERCQVPVKPVTLPAEVKTPPPIVDLTEPDPHSVALLVEHHCFFCLGFKSRTIYSIQESSPYEVDGYELLRRYVGVRTADSLNDIFDAMLFTNKSLLTSEFPAPLLCEKCVELVADMEDLHRKLEMVQKAILKRIRRLRKLVIDNHVGENRTQFEEHLKETLKGDWESGLEILDNFRKGVEDETREQIEIHLEHLEQVDGFSVDDANVGPEDEEEEFWNRKQLPPKEFSDMSVQTDDVVRNFEIKILKVSVEEKRLSEVDFEDACPPPKATTPPVVNLEGNDNTAPNDNEQKDIVPVKPEVDSDIEDVTPLPMSQVKEEPEEDDVTEDNYAEELSPEPSVEKSLVLEMPTTETMTPPQVEDCTAKDSEFNQVQTLPITATTLPENVDETSFEITELPQELLLTIADSGSPTQPAQPLPVLTEIPSSLDSHSTPQIILEPSTVTSSSDKITLTFHGPDGQTELNITPEQLDSYLPSSPYIESQPDAENQTELEFLAELPPPQESSLPVSSSIVAPSCFSFTRTSSSPAAVLLRENGSILIQRTVPKTKAPSVHSSQEEEEIEEEETEEDEDDDVSVIILDSESEHEENVISKVEKIPVPANKRKRKKREETETDTESDDEDTSSDAAEDKVTADKLESFTDSDSSADRKKRKRRKPKKTKKRKCVISEPVPKSLNCSLCHQKFHRDQDVRRHMLNVHFSEPVKDYGTKISFPCSECFYKCSRLPKLQKHMRVAHNLEVPSYIINPRTIKCEICGFSKDSQDLMGLLTHLLEHENFRKKFSCEDCHQGFTTEQLFHLHLCPHVGLPRQVGNSVDDDLQYFQTQNEIRCRFCPDLNFPGEFSLKGHFEQHHPDQKLFKCTLCRSGEEDTAFSSRSDLKSHTMKTHNGVKYKCRLCPQEDIGPLVEFADWSEFVIHLNFTHFGGYYQCNGCSRMFSKRTLMEEHQKLHKQLQCNLCDKSFSSNYGLNVHMHKIHKDKTRSLSPLQPPDKNSRNEQGVDYVIRPGKHPKRFSCNVCGYLCTTISIHRRHMQQFHGIMVDKKIHTRTYQCDFCGFSKSSKLPGFLQHLEEHEAPRKQFTCEDCNASFTQRQMYQMHRCPQMCKLPGTALIGEGQRLSHGYEKQVHKCRICVNIFKSEATMLQHIRTDHNGENAFICEVCGLDFAKKDHIRTHMITAHGAVPYKCRLCVPIKEFTKEFDIFSHTNMEHFGCYYECPICHIKFIVKGALAEHMATHEDTKNKICNFCGVTMKSQKGLHRHLAVFHTQGYVKFMCEHCGKEFVERGNLVKHVKAKHPREQQSADDEEEQEIEEVEEV